MGRLYSYWTILQRRALFALRIFPRPFFKHRAVLSGLRFLLFAGVFSLYLRAMGVEYRKATMDDLSAIISFVDYWLSGGGKTDKISGAGHDYFVRGGQQKSYLEKYSVMLATIAGEIVGWAVKTHKGVLIHLLVAATFQKCGIGSEMLRRMNPAVVRSKSDQSTGDPAGFYRKHGYVSTSPEKIGKHKNIEMFGRAGECEEATERISEKAVLAADKPESSDLSSSGKQQRMIEIIAKKVGFGSKKRS